MARRTVTMTPALAASIGLDAGNRRMRQGGRVEWDEGDWNFACGQYEMAMETGVETDRTFMEVVDPVESIPANHRQCPVCNREGTYGELCAGCRRDFSELGMGEGLCH